MEVVRERRGVITIPRPPMEVVADTLVVHKFALASHPTELHDTRSVDGGLVVPSAYLWPNRASYACPMC